ncbi:hypothetical protein [Bradyrhizobium sp. RD5-C2]|uniref:hypothetical protein n=1 Tax=Bradyrhizobium sp. RD5-C2 TaxID=244562 RepID=UPI001CC345E7|nr:hypothetical protein [Bradyrhizobium sp. RD5-C2]GIQ75160.1 hypothetical protein BraRD5C2_36010 [Bradyrhizobium sp. RD5-C2]
MSNVKVSLHSSRIIMQDGSNAHASGIIVFLGGRIMGGDSNFCCSGVSRRMPEILTLDPLVDTPVHILVAQRVVAPAGPRCRHGEAGADRRDRDTDLKPPCI